ncbi:hypothetical protein [Shewanella sp. yb_14]|uniref:hypothetical protein n=1 Tax=unclassified Shewanella TaxID=196818 RepID=UPI00370A9BB1
MKRYAVKKGKRWLECYSGHNKPTDITLKPKKQPDTLPETRGKQGHQAAKR